MSNNNDSSPEALAGYMVMSMVVVAVVVFLYLAAVFCAALTLLCVWAWNEERRLFGHTITPYEARGFVVCGIIGAVVIAFLGLILAMNNIGNYEQIGYLAAGGYIFGSLGFVGWHAEQEEQREKEAAQRQMIAAMQRPAPPEHTHVVRRREPATHFEYASWDDEEPRA